jgi:hypothetical protein
MIFEVITVMKIWIVVFWIPGRSVHVNRVSCVSPVNTLINKKIIFRLTFVVQLCSIHWNTAESIRSNASLARSSWPDVVSQIVVAYARRERNNANNVWLTGAG